MRVTLSKLDTETAIKATSVLGALGYDYKVEAEEGDGDEQAQGWAMFALTQKGLTGIEAMTAWAMLRGLSDEEIAAEQLVSVETVARRRNWVLVKTGAADIGTLRRLVQTYEATQEQG